MYEVHPSRQVDAPTASDLYPHLSFLKWAQAKPGAVCAVGYRDDLDITVSWTYAEIEDLALRVASGLRTLGLVKGDVISVQLPNWQEFLAIYLASCHLGTILNPIPPLYRERELREIVGRTGSKLIVTATRSRGVDYEKMFRSVLREIRSKATLFAAAPDLGKGSFYEDLLSSPPATWESISSVGMTTEDPMEIQFTSGTTGRPKAVVHSHRTVCFGMRGFPAEVGLGASDVVHMPGSFGHQTGFLFGCVMPLSYGMKVVLQDRWDPQRMLLLAKEEGVTTTSGAAPFILDMCDAARGEGAPQSLRWVKSGGAPIPRELASRVECDLGATLITSWGMTENGVCTISSPEDDIDTVASTDGRPVPWTQVRVVDDEGLRLGTNESGLILVKGPSQCLGYRQDDGTIVPSSNEDGWFDTGDVGKLSENGYLRIQGRRKELIIRGGENIPIVELEEALSRHPGVVHAALVGLPDHRLGETACAVIVPAEEPSPSLQDICSWLEAGGFSKHYWPESLVTREALPMTASGKIKRVELKLDVIGSGVRDRRG